MLTQTQKEIHESSLLAAKAFRSLYEKDKNFDLPETVIALESYIQLRRMLPRVGGGDTRHVGYQEAYPLTQKEIVVRYYRG